MYIHVYTNIKIQRIYEDGKNEVIFANKVKR